MIIGRLTGVFTGVVLASIFHSDNLFLQIILWLVFTVIGFGISLAVSIIAGINVNTDQPNYLDSEKYWTDKYGEEMGKQAYKIWLDEL